MFDIMKPNAMRRMLTARERVAKRNPFFASILFGANMIETKERVKTIQTNGLDIFFNPQFVESKENDAHLEGMLLKAAIHTAMLHISRRRYRDQKRWQQACDFPVNDVTENYFKLPDDAPRDKKFGAMAPEAVYEQLQQQEDKKQKGKGKGGKGEGQQQKDKQQGKGQGQPGDEDGDQEGEGQGQGQDDPNDGETPGGMCDATEEELEEGEREGKRNLANAIEKSQKAGTMPGNLQRLIQDLIPKEKIDWKDLIRDMSRDAKSNTTRTWQRPNRRRLGGGEYMPGYGQDKVYKLVMCLDVSGSVSEEMIREMCGEAASLLDQDLVNHVTLVSVDTRIQNTLEAKTAEDLVGWNAGGGGGTDFNSAMTEVGKMQDVIGCIFLTDMYTSSFGPQPDFPVVWVDWAGSGAKAPYGRTVPYK